MSEESREFRMEMEKAASAKEEVAILRNKKEILEHEIFEAVYAFESSTGLKVSDVDLRHQEEYIGTPCELMFVTTEIQL